MSISLVVLVVACVQPPSSAAQTAPTPTASVPSRPPTPPVEELQLEPDQAPLRSARRRSCDDTFPASKGHGEVARIHPRHRPEPALPHLLFRPDKPRRQRERGLGDRRLAGVRSGWLWDTFAMGAVGYTSQPLYAPDDKDGTTLLAPGQEGITVLGQAYGQLRYRDYALLTGYRQMVDDGREPPGQPNAPEHLRRRDSEGRGRLRRLQRGLPVGHRPGTRTSSFRCPSRPEAMVPARVWS